MMKKVVRDLSIGILECGEGIIDGVILIDRNWRSDGRLRGTHSSGRLDAFDKLSPGINQFDEPQVHAA
jgi:hypothetical protein